MNTVAVVVDFHQSPYLELELADRPVGAWVRAALMKAMPEVPIISLGPWATMAGFLKNLIESSKEFDEVVVVSADAPFLRAELVVQLLALHRRYRSQYTFADGFPSGLAPEILDPRILPILKSWATEKPLSATREGLFSVLQTDINRFDVETHLSPVDLRMKRLSFHADSRRSFALLQRQLAFQSLELDAWLRHLDEDGSVIQTLPATLLVQVCAGVRQVPIWLPVLEMEPRARELRTEISRSQWNLLLDKALAFSGDLTVLPAFWGEPSLHSDIGGLLCDALEKPGVRLCVETSGLGWNRPTLELLASKAAGRIDWIVELDSNQRSTYQQIRGEGYDEAHLTAMALIELFPAHVWPQTVRMTSNESEMEEFYKHWKAAAGQVIIQKHNDYSGRLPRLKPADLSPWKRSPCWHVARDLAIFLDGTVVPCRDDFGRTLVLGNAYSESFDEIWTRSAELLNRHSRQDYPEVCRNCDEYYTYSF